MGANCSSSSATVITQSHSQQLQKQQSGTSQQHLPGKDQSECVVKEDVPAVSVKEMHESQPAQAEKAQDFPSEKAETAQPIAQSAEQVIEPASEQPKEQTYEATQQQPEEQEQSSEPASSPAALPPQEIKEEETKAAVVEDTPAPIFPSEPADAAIESTQEQQPASTAAEPIAEFSPAIVDSFGVAPSAEEASPSPAVFADPVAEDTPALQFFPSEPIESSSAAEEPKEKPVEFVAPVEEIDAPIATPPQSFGAVFEEEPVTSAPVEPVTAAEEPQPIEQAHHAESVSRQLAETPADDVAVTDA